MGADGGRGAARGCEWVQGGATGGRRGVLPGDGGQ